MGHAPSVLSQCIHESEDHEFGRMVVDMQSFKYVTYELDNGKERKKIALVMSQVSVVYLKGIHSFKLHLEILHIV
jgi:hypothetical protein